MIQRELYKKILQFLQPNKVVVIYGPRRVGKTTILNQVLNSQEKKTLFVDGESENTRRRLSVGDTDLLKEFVGSNELLIIDEAQKIPEIGRNLKLIVDHIP